MLLLPLASWMLWLNGAGTAALLTCSAMAVFIRAKTPFAAAMCHACLVFGNSFDYSGWMPNVLELGGSDTAHFFPACNSFVWTLGFVFATLLAWLKRRTGSWALLFGGPIVMRLCAAVLWQHHVSVTPAREHVLAVRQRQRAARHGA